MSRRMGGLRAGWWGPYSTPGQTAEEVMHDENFPGHHQMEHDKAHEIDHDRREKHE